MLGTSGTSGGIGVRGENNDGTGVLGSSTSGEAGHFDGKVVVNGNGGIGTGNPTERILVRDFEDLDDRLKR